MLLQGAIVVTILLNLAGSAIGQKKPLPEFGDYPVQERVAVQPATPKLTSRRARLIRTAIRTQTTEGANFAGHYRIATWGCGAGCVQFAIVDLKTGNVYFPPEVETVMVLLEQEDDQLQYQVGSRLLVIIGQKTGPNWRNPDVGKFYYEWKDGRLILLQKVKLERK